MRQRPDSLILIAVYELVMAAVLLIVSCVVLPIALLLTPFGSGGMVDFFARFFVVGLMLAATFGIGIASGIVGIGLLLRKSWARVGAIALAILALIGFPIWTVIGILIIVYLLGDEGRTAFYPERRRAALTDETTDDPSVWDVPTVPIAKDRPAHEPEAPDHSGANLLHLEPDNEESDQSSDNDLDRPLPG